jgi:hypothetical protein
MYHGRTALMVIVVLLALVQVASPRVVSTATAAPAAACPGAVCVFVPVSMLSPTIIYPSTGVITLAPNATVFVDSANYLHIVGEVTNTTFDTHILVQLNARFYDKAGGLVATDFAYTYLDDLPLGETTCFEMILEQPASWRQIAFEPVRSVVSSDRVPLLTLFSISGSYDTALQQYTLRGEARNDEVVPVQFVQVVGTLYDGADRPIGCGFTYVNSRDLNPGQSSAFTVNEFGVHSSATVRYKVHATGDLP